MQRETRQRYLSVRSRHQDFTKGENAIADKLEEATEKRFILADSNIQIFEKKPKEPKPTQD
jgi:hypothetical protein